MLTEWFGSGNEGFYTSSKGTCEPRAETALGHNLVSLTPLFLLDSFWNTLRISYQIALSPCPGEHDSFQDSFS
jgi:hypothetical protein